MDKRCTRESKCSNGGIRRAHPGQSVRQQLEDTAKEAEERGEKEKKEKRGQEEREDTAPLLDARRAALGMRNAPGRYLATETSPPLFCSLRALSFRRLRRLSSQLFQEWHICALTLDYAISKVVHSLSLSDALGSYRLLLPQRNVI